MPFYIRERCFFLLLILSVFFFVQCNGILWIIFIVAYVVVLLVLFVCLWVNFNANRWHSPFHINAVVSFPTIIICSTMLWVSVVVVFFHFHFAVIDNFNKIDTCNPQECIPYKSYSMCERLFFSFTTSYFSGDPSRFDYRSPPYFF